VLHRLTRHADVQLQRPLDALQLFQLGGRPLQVLGKKFSLHFSFVGDMQQSSYGTLKFNFARTSFQHNRYKSIYLRQQVGGNIKNFEILAKVHDQQTYFPNNECHNMLRSTYGTVPFVIY
jgi:hypothetical protein